MAESDKDSPVLHHLRLHFSGFIAQMVDSMRQGRDRSSMLTAPISSFSLAGVEFLHWLSVA